MGSMKKIEPSQIDLAPLLDAVVAGLEERLLKAGHEDPKLPRGVVFKVKENYLPALQSIVPAILEQVNALIEAEDPAEAAFIVPDDISGLLP